MSVKGPTLGQTEAVVKNELAQFIKQHTGQDALSVIDEIVLSYVVGIVESLFIDGDAAGDLFDADQFSEMMAAYIPSFASINCQAITQWMLKLSASLDKKAKTNSSFSSMLFKTEMVALPHDQVIKVESSPFIIQRQENHHGGKRSRSRSDSSQSDEERNGDDGGKSMGSEREHNLSLLSEMFPHLTLEELQRALGIAAGDCQKAAQLLLLHKGDLSPEDGMGGQGRGPTTWNRNRTVSNSSSNNDLEEDFLQQDKQLREQILNKYAYIDQDDDVREHRPVAPKFEPKKLIRYRDNKIVSVKGERYSEVKLDNPDDPNSKTLVPLKAQRQYRAH